MVANFALSARPFLTVCADYIGTCLQALGMDCHQELMHVITSRLKLDLHGGTRLGNSGPWLLILASSQKGWTT